MTLVKYGPSDIVMALDNGKVYEAKVLKVLNIDNNYKYFIHFQGWNPKFDTWINEELVSAKADEARMQSLNNAINGLTTTAKDTKKGKGKRTNDDQDEEVDEAEAKRQAHAALQEVHYRKRRKQLSNRDLVEIESDDVNNTNLLAIPTVLKKHLVDEWGTITNETKRLLKFPRRKSVEVVIDQYLVEKSKSVEYDHFKELFDCLRNYFDMALSTILLYRHERAQVFEVRCEYVSSRLCQYDAIVAAVSAHGTFTPSKVYGAEHLLRFFVRMPRLMANVCLTAKNVKGIVEKLVDFMNYLGANYSSYFEPGDYILADEAMQGIATCKKWTCTVAVVEPTDEYGTRNRANRRK